MKLHLPKALFTALLAACMTSAARAEFSSPISSDAYTNGGTITASPTVEADTRYTLTTDDVAISAKGYDIMLIGSDGTEVALGAITADTLWISQGNYIANAGDDLNGVGTVYINGDSALQIRTATNDSATYTSNFSIGASSYDGGGWGSHPNLKNAALVVGNWQHKTATTTITGTMDVQEDARIVLQYGNKLVLQGGLTGDGDLDLSRQRANDDTGNGSSVTISGSTTNYTGAIKFTGNDIDLLLGYATVNLGGLSGGTSSGTATNIVGLADGTSAATLNLNVAAGKSHTFSGVIGSGVTIVNSGEGTQIFSNAVFDGCSTITNSGNLTLSGTINILDVKNLTGNVAYSNGENGFASGTVWLVQNSGNGSVSSDGLTLQVYGEALDLGTDDGISVDLSADRRYHIITDVTYNEVTMGTVERFFAHSGTKLYTADTSILSKTAVEDASATVYLDNPGKSITASSIGESFNNNIVITSGTTVSAEANDCFGAFYTTSNTARSIILESGAVFDFNGKDPHYKFILKEGSTLRNTGADREAAHHMQAAYISLEGGATVDAQEDFGLRYGANKGTSEKLDLNGHTLTKTGAGTFFLYSTTVNAGTIDIREGALMIHGGSGFANVDLKMAAGTTQEFANDLNGKNWKSLKTSGDATLKVGSSTSLNIVNGTTAAGKLTKAGAGTLQFSNATELNGGLQVSGGTVTLNGATTLGGLISVASGATLNVNEGATVTIDLLGGFTTSALPAINSLVMRDSYQIVDNKGTSNLTDVIYKGETKKLEEDGTLAVSGKIYYAVEAGADKVVTVGGDAATPDTADATEFYVGQNGTIRVSGLASEDTAKEILRTISGNGTVELACNTGDDWSTQLVSSAGFTGTTYVTTGKFTLNNSTYGNTLKLGADAHMQITGNTEFSKTMTLESGEHQLHTNGSNVLTLTGTVNGEGSLKKLGGGTLKVMNGASVAKLITANGTTSIEGGSVDKLILTGGTVNVSGGVVKAIDYDSDGVVNFNLAQGSEHTFYNVGDIKVQTNNNSDHYGRHMNIASGVSLVAKSFTNQWGMGTLDVDGEMTTDSITMTSGGNGDTRNIITGDGVINTQNLKITNAGTYRFSVEELNISDTLNVNSNNATMEQNSGSINVNRMDISAGSVNQRGGVINVNGQVSSTGGTINMFAGQMNLNYTVAGNTIANLDMAGNNDRNGHLKLADKVALEVKTNFWLGGTSSVVLNEGASLTRDGMTITGKSADSKLTRLVNGDNNIFEAGSDDHEVANAAVSITKEVQDSNTLALKLTNSSVANNSSSNLSVTNAGNNLSEVHAIKGNINLQNVDLNVQGALASLSIAENLSVGAHTGTQVLDSKEGCANLTVSGAASFAASSKLYANLTLNDGATLTINNQNNSTAAVIEGTLTLLNTDKGITLTGTVLDTLEGLQAPGSGEVVLFKGVDSLVLGGQTYSVGSETLNTGSNVKLSDYFSNDRDIDFGKYYLAFNDSTGDLTAGLIIPEPTTTTLSLLALAGLCARRRRK